MRPSEKGTGKRDRLKQQGWNENLRVYEVKVHAQKDLNEENIKAANGVI